MCLIPLLLLFSRSFVSDSLRPHGLQHTRLPCPSPSPGICSDSRPLSRWCQPTGGIRARKKFLPQPWSCLYLGQLLLVLLIGLKKENYMPRACSILIFFVCLECLLHPSFPVMSRTGVTTTSPLRLLEVTFFKVKIWSIVSITWEPVRTVISQAPTR